MVAVSWTAMWMLDGLRESEDLLEDPGHDGVLARQNVPPHSSHHLVFLVPGEGDVWQLVVWVVAAG